LTISGNFIQRSRNRHEGRYERIHLEEAKMICFIQVKGWNFKNIWLKERPDKNMIWKNGNLGEKKP